MRGKHILIVEDSFLVSASLAELIHREEAIVEGPVGRTEEAIDFLNSKFLDGALLDVQLQGGETATPVATALQERQIPFIVVSAYSPDALPKELRSAPHIAKPFMDEELIQLARRVFGRRDE